MASKSKRRRKVLGASCILAALIIAGSSFAWFTSKDEVTNRLSANADYGVSIVESFAPPKNWIPGQEVNKDVYAVNTGTIGAFVKESVSGTMTIVKEESVPVGNFSSEKDNLNKLTAGERYVIEAGSYLAFAPGGVTKGEKIVATTPDNGDLDAYVSETDDFIPTVNGLYVFRRSIDVAADRTETFEYQGYYYYDGQFYKVKITSVTPDDNADIAGDGKKTDGQLSGATFTLSKDVTTKVSPTSLTYDSGNHRLIATVEGTDAPTNLNTLASEYDQAAHAYEAALAAQTAAVRDDGTATDALKNATAAHNAALATQTKAQADYNREVANYTAINGRLTDANSDQSTKQSDLSAAKSTLYGSKNYTPTTEPTVPTTPGDFNATWIAAYADTTGSYYEMLQALLGKNSAPADAEAFRLELYAYGTAAAANGGLGKTWATNITVADMVADLNYTELTTGFNTYLSNNVNSEEHDQYAAEATYLAKKRQYDADVADYNAKDAAKTAADTTVANLTAALNSSKNALYGNTSSYTPTDAPDFNSTTMDQTWFDAATDFDHDSLYGKLLQANITEKTTNDAFTAASSAQGTSGGNHTAADTAVVTAKANLDNAKKAYEDAVAAYTGAGDIIIYINLSDKVVTSVSANDQWQIKPTTLSGDEAVFYYTGILDAGHTSSMLINSVELAPTVTQDMYKSFDFDLNVALKSAQITYGNDNETIVATAATEELGLTPTMSNNKSLDTVLTW